MQAEPVSEDLEEAVDGYTRKVLERTNCLIGNQPVGEEISKAVKFGAEWQKEQLMTKAVDGEVGYWNIRGLSVNMELPSKFEEGDKVKLIIIKED